MEQAKKIMDKIKNIAPDIHRQRLLIEGFWTIDVKEETVSKYLTELAAELNLRTYGDPVIFAPASGMGKDENAGFDAFVPLIDSGISGYFWSKNKFLSVVIYTCKGFSNDDAINFTKSYFAVEEEMVSFGF